MRRIVGIDDDDDKSLLLCNSGIVLTVRMSDTTVCEGDDKADAETFGIDNVLLVFLLLAVVPSVAEYEVVVAGGVDGLARR